MITEQLVNDLKTKYGDLSQIDLEVEDQVMELVVTSPSRPQVTKYLQELSDDKKQFQAAENFCLGCIVFPERKDVQELFNKRPLLISTLAKKLESKAGFGAKISEKKL